MRRTKAISVPVVIGVTVCLLMTVLAFHRLEHRGSPSGTSSEAPPPLGSTIVLQGVDFHASRRTVLLSLSTQCVIGAASRDLYEELIRHRPPDVRVVAVLPQPMPEALAYMDQLAIQPDQVIQRPAAMWGGQATPAILLIEAGGALTGRWEGELGVDDLRELAVKVGSPSPSFIDRSVSRTRLATTRLVTKSEWMQLRDTVALVDVRSRSEFSTEHIVGAVNIPADELPVRARHELPMNMTVVVACGTCPECVSGTTASRLQSPCLRGLARLLESGFQDVVVLVD